MNDGIFDASGDWGPVWKRGPRVFERGVVNVDWLKVVDREVNVGANVRGSHLSTVSMIRVLLEGNLHADGSIFFINLRNAFDLNLRKVSGNVVGQVSDVKLVKFCWVCAERWGDLEFAYFRLND